MTLLEADVTPGVAEHAERLARSLNLLAAFIRLNPEFAATFKYSLDDIKLPIPESEDAEEVLRSVTSAADLFGLHVFVRPRTEVTGYAGLSVQCGEVRLDVYAARERLPLPVDEYLPDAEAARAAELAEVSS